MKRARKGKDASRIRDTALSSSSFAKPFSETGSGSPLSYLSEPPSFSAVSDPNVVVSFKNILKKDTTTKSKALEHLIQHVQDSASASEDGDDAILEIWAQIYPRLSINNSRRVRELCHVMQLELLKSAQKRMERYLPRTVGAWLAGLYDRDRVVNRAVNEGLSSFLTSSEKIADFWRKCQRQILQYANDAIQESPDTLSDNRSTNQEDAEAKYNRVVVASLSLVLGLLQKLDNKALNKFRLEYDEYFSHDVVWNGISSKDSQVRKTTSQLLVACLERQLPYSESNDVKQAFLVQGFRQNQSGSALEYVEALAKMTENDPFIWSGYAVNNKKPPLTGLQNFVAKGSQNSASQFWEHLKALLCLIPLSTLSLETTSRLLSSLIIGITGREEFRPPNLPAWKCYVDVSNHFMKVLSDSDVLAISQQHLLPLFAHFMFPDSSETSSDALGLSPPSILFEIHLALLQSSSLVIKASASEWERLGNKICEDISSDDIDFEGSYIRDATSRWFTLVGLLHNRLGDMDANYPDLTTTPSISVVKHCLNLGNNNRTHLKAIWTVECALSSAPHLFATILGDQIASFLHMTANDNLHEIAGSPTLEHTLSCLRLLGFISCRRDDYESTWLSWVNAALKFPANKPRLLILNHLVLQEHASTIARKCRPLQDFLFSQSLEAAEAKHLDTGDTWNLLQNSLVHAAVSPENSDRIVKELAALLADTSRDTDKILDILELMAKNSSQQILQEDTLTELMAKMLSISELENNDISSRADRIRLLLDETKSELFPAVNIISSNLEKVNPQCLSVNTLVAQANSLIISSNGTLEGVLPKKELWMAELRPLLERPINPILSITDKIGGALALPSGAPLPSLESSMDLRDRSGRSAAARMAIYTSEVIDSNRQFFCLPRQLQVDMLYPQLLSMQLTLDQITCMDGDGLWHSLQDASLIEEAEKFVSNTRTTLNRLAHELQIYDSRNDTCPAVIFDLIDIAAKESCAFSFRGIHNARVLTELLSIIIDVNGATANIMERVLGIESIRVEPEAFLSTTGLIAGLGESLRSSNITKNLINRLISSLILTSSVNRHALEEMILFNGLAQSFGHGQLPVAKNRIIFVVNQILTWTEDLPGLSVDCVCEIGRSLKWLLQCIAEVYGPHWDKTLQFCIQAWTRASYHSVQEYLPFVHSTLQLFRTLDDRRASNDDLEDALNRSSNAISAGIVGLLKLSRKTLGQPLAIVDSMISCEAERLSVKQIPEPADLFILMNSQTWDTQTAVFQMLHKKLLAQQESKSINFLLSGFDAQLPNELLDLLRDVPILDNFTDEGLSRFPLSIRSYLLSWILVFDIFSASSFKMRSNYIQHLKMGDHASSLLKFLFDVLGHSASLPLALEKQNLGPKQICSYDIKLADVESSDKNLHWLLVHLYYLILRYTPALFRSWFIDCRSKQTKLAVESWTTKYFSPLIISVTLDYVQEWTNSQESVEGDEKLSVKISRKANEITAGYNVDDSTAAIVIKIPSSYPIEGVAVVGLHRVAVTERKWQSWILTTQGVIAFSDGSIIDGLQVFKRNISGALKGQSECAICYSIISTDKRMPDKRCSTCKNFFHRSCLYRWFQSSNQNTCPLCRNPIDYLGAETAKRRQV